MEKTELTEKFIWNIDNVYESIYLLKWPWKFKSIFSGCSFAII